MKVTELSMAAVATSLISLFGGAASATNVGILDTITGYVNGSTSTSRRS
jgi:hypothetical protein